MSLGSSNNAILFNNCQSLKNPIVTLLVNRDLITKGNTGFSLQMNCYPQTNPQATYQGHPMEWFQYCINVVNSECQAHVQLWSFQDPKNIGHGWSLSPQDDSFRSLSSTSLARCSVMRIMLHTDSNDNIEAVDFNVAPTGLPFDADFEVVLPTDLRCAIYGFQVNLVGPGNGAHTTFTSAGAS